MSLFLEVADAAHAQRHSLHHLQALRLPHWLASSAGSFGVQRAGRALLLVPSDDPHAGRALELVPFDDPRVGLALELVPSDAPNALQRQVGH